MVYKRIFSCFTVVSRIIFNVTFYNKNPLSNWISIRFILIKNAIEFWNATYLKDDLCWWGFLPIPSLYGCCFLQHAVRTRRCLDRIHTEFNERTCQRAIPHSPTNGLQMTTAGKNAHASEAGTPICNIMSACASARVSPSRPPIWRKTRQRERITRMREQYIKVRERRRRREVRAAVRRGVV